MKIFIDPGHGGSDPGAVANGIFEKVINLTVAQELKTLLESAGFEIMMSREADLGVGLSERCVMANNWGASYFISIHHNAGGGDGFEVIHSIWYGEGENLAYAVGDQFKATGQNCRNIYSRHGTNGDYYAVIRETAMPAIITEYCFLDSADVSAIDSAEKLKNEAEAIFKGVCFYCGITIPQPESTIDWKQKYEELVAKFKEFAASL